MEALHKSAKVEVAAGNAYRPSRPDTSRVQSRGPRASNYAALVTRAPNKPTIPMMDALRGGWSPDDVLHDGPNDDMIFGQLEELDLRFNDIPEVEALSLALYFKNLKKIQLSNTNFPKKYGEITLEVCRSPSW